MSVQKNESVLVKGETWIEELKESLKLGQIPSRLFHDEEIFKLEKERLFTKTWNFLAHETEIPNNGDYVTRYIADDSFIVSRDNKGEIHVHLNSCSHRGMELSNVERGNSSHFRCPYHGWTFKNDGKLIGVPLEKKVYGEMGTLKHSCGLVSPHVGIYNGMIFGSIDPQETLDDYLGDFKWYLDIYTNKTEGGVEVYGAPQRWIAEANWKTGSDNFVGDVYHVQVTHRGNSEAIAIMTNTEVNAEILNEDGGIQVTAGKGGVCLTEVPPGMVAGMPEFYHESIRVNLPEQNSILDGTKGFSLKELNGTIFPNFSLLTTPYIPTPDGNVMIPHFLTVRVWRPIDVGKMEVWSWMFVDKGAPDWYKEMAYKEYVRTFGPSGTFEQDDAENWQGITKIAKGVMAKNRLLNYTMGMDNGNNQQISNWPGPGKAFNSSINESNQREFFKLYAEYLSGK